VAGVVVFWRVVASHEWAAPVVAAATGRRALHGCKRHAVEQLSQAGSQQAEALLLPMLPGAAGTGED
jgi:hypothetical protein